ncbi:tetracycline-efflux transporter, putative [Ricinus communis]|uniref:Tetracycline-efflux transporter, putative n=1 Tax=Ricinus communis TaxID=3988 RepID=B9TG09_RICCO|nr:tetracycline-efflux transporter, putative [Ricinus communis]
MVVSGMGNSLVFAIIPMIGRALQLQELVVEWPALGIVWHPRELAITSLSAMTALVASVFSAHWGRASDVRGRRQVLLVGLAGYGVCALLFSGTAALGLFGVLSGSLLWSALMVMRGVHASVTTASQPAASAYVADITLPNERTRGIGKLNAAIQVGMMSGPVLAWFAGISLLAPLVIHALVMFAMALLVHRRLPETVQQTRLRGPRTRLRFFDPRYARFTVIGLVTYMCLAIMQQTLGFYIQDILHIDPAAAAQRFAMAMMCSSMAMFVMQIVAAQRFAWSPLTMLKLGLPVALLAFLVVAFATGLPQILLAMTLFGVGMGLALPGYAAGASLAVTADEQGGIAGISSSVASVVICSAATRRIALLMASCGAVLGRVAALTPYRYSFGRA